MAKLSVGQELFWVPDYHGKQARFVTVTRVGRKWAELSNGYTIAVDTLRARDVSGRAWLSEAEYREYAANDHAWSLLQKRMGYGLRPEGVTRQDILQAAALLQLEVHWEE